MNGKILGIILVILVIALVWYYGYRPAYAPTDVGPAATQDTSTMGDVAPSDGTPEAEQNADVQAEGDSADVAPAE